MSPNAPSVTRRKAPAWPRRRPTRIACPRRTARGAGRGRRGCRSTRPGGGRHRRATTGPGRASRPSPSSSSTGRVPSSRWSANAPPGARVGRGGRGSVSPATESLVPMGPAPPGEERSGGVAAPEGHGGELEAPSARRPELGRDVEPGEAHLLADPGVHGGERERVGRLPERVHVLARGRRERGGPLAGAAPRTGGARAGTGGRPRRGPRATLPPPPARCARSRAAGRGRRRRATSRGRDELLARAMAAKPGVPPPSVRRPKAPSIQGARLSTARPRAAATACAESSPPGASRAAASRARVRTGRDPLRIGILRGPAGAVSGRRTARRARSAPWLCYARGSRRPRRAGGRRPAPPPR